MGGLLLALLLVGAVWLVVKVVKMGSNPTTKTTDQLLREQRAHNRRLSYMQPGTPAFAKAAAEAHAVDDELAARAAGTATAISSNDWRAYSLYNFDSFRAKARQEGKTETVALESALVATLFEDIKASAPAGEADLLTSEKVEYFMVEALPFKGLPAERARQAVVDYICWRHAPESVDAQRLAADIREGFAALAHRNPELIERIQTGPFLWRPLLDENFAQHSENNLTL